MARQDLNPPHGGQLVNRYADEKAAAELKQQTKRLKDWTLSHRQLCDVEMLLDGSFSPLSGFLNRTDYQSVIESMRLIDGTLWPIPVTLDVSEEFALSIQEGEQIVLRDFEGVAIAVMRVESIWQPDKLNEALKVFGTQDTAHPAVDYLFNQAGDYYLGGQLIGLQRPVHYDFKVWRHSPAELRSLFDKWGWKRVVAFQTRNPMHRAHVELTHRAAAQVEANLLIHPVVGMTKPGDVDHYCRVRCYEKILARYPEQTTALSLLPLAMRMGGPREALWHAIIRKNYGCTHFIVGRDHAGPGRDSNGQAFYGPYDAQQLLAQHEDELGITMIPFQQMVYVEERAEFMPIDQVPEGATPLDISGTEFRRRLQKGLEIPAWFSYPEVIAELQRRYPPRFKQGFTVFFTGLSGAGKSTIANALRIKLMERGDRPLTLLDGDIVRTHLSSELGFSRQHRDLNIQRIGFVASEITKNGGIAICAPIAPYAQTRRKVRQMIEPLGGFIEVYVATPLQVCEQRDRKGLYAKARAGLIKEFTGISDPYEPPENPELIIDTQGITPDEAAQRIILKLESMGFIR